MLAEVGSRATVWWAGVREGQGGVGGGGSGTGVGTTAAAGMWAVAPAPGLLFTWGGLATGLGPSGRSGTTGSVVVYVSVSVYGCGQYELSAV